MQQAMTEAYAVLDSVFRRGAYVNIAIKNADCRLKALMTNIVYGTVERFYECEYTLSILSKSVKPALKTLMLESIYMLNHMNLPPYAVVNSAVNVAGEKFGEKVKGFVNAVLKNVAAGKVKMPVSGDDYERIKYNAPPFVIEKLRKDGFDPAAFLLPPQKKVVHFRITGISEKETVLNSVPDAERSYAGGYTAKRSDVLDKLNDSGKITFQSASSMECVNAFGDLKGKMMLDVCAAPGGKAAYAASLGAAVTACDIHPHRVGLIKSYAARTGVTLDARVADATVFEPAFEEAFDCVLADVPCSGLGVVASRPDVVLNKKPDDVEKLAAIQYGILSVCARYVKRGGKLVYSTCTPLKEETERQIERFLSENDNFRILNYKNNLKFGRLMMPDEIDDGFFVAVTEKI